ncbi:MAG: phosphoribosylglycinamide formyltransferase [Planctomycetota bacterium]|jgi:formyltetrahydrofolate-dependent phosphoribosylglycinamide formyltransferase
MPDRLRLGALISGGGRTLLNLVDRIEAGSLPATVAVVIASRGDAAGVERARQRGLDVHVVRRRDFESEDAMHDAITRRLVQARVDLVCLCGYLRWFRIDPPFAGRVINIHPALLPEFGGQGMHGLHVHRAVLAAGRTESGCTIHFVDEEYDHGPIILQRTCPVRPDDDEHTLAARVFEQECQAYPEAIALFAAGRLGLERGRAVIRPERATPSSPSSRSP